MSKIEIRLIRLKKSLINRDDDGSAEVLAGSGVSSRQQLFDRERHRVCQASPRVVEVTDRK